MSVSKQELEAFDAGWEACRDRTAARENNPYQDSALAPEWDRGWEAASYFYLWKEAAE